MPNWKYPCIKCCKPVKSNQKGFKCNICDKWIHFKCTNLTLTQYDFLEVNEDTPFFCLICKPRPSYADLIFENINASNNNDVSNSSTLPDNNNDNDTPNSSLYFSSAHSSDFEYIDDSDTDDRGLNFESLSICTNNHNQTKTKKRNVNLGQLPIQTRNYKYPCVICLGACRDKCQDSICCTLCDEWTHQKCSDLTINQFNKYCLPENVNTPFYCDNCLYGSRRNIENQNCLRASEISSLDTNDIYNLCPNSIFRDKDDIPTTEYLTTEELNIEIQKTPNNIRIIHINAVSLCKHIGSITDMIAGLVKLPSILFISETRVQNEKEELQINQIQIEGYKFVLDNSPTNAGGTAIYISDDLKYNERPDIKFEYANCEACFIEIICDTPGQNPIFGALYRHPGHNARLFCSYLGEFLELFAERGTKLTIMGDINIDLNKTNVATTEYMNTLSSLGFSLLINQPTRIFHNEGANTVSCSTIDHLITNSSSDFTKAGILIADVSDHLPIFGIMSLSKHCKNTYKNTYRRRFHESKKEKYLEHLKENLQNYDLNKLDPNSLMDRILLCIKDAINKTFPLRKISRKEAKKLLNPWMTKEILDEIKKRDKLKKKVD